MESLSLPELYDCLLCHSGHRHWWPGETRDETAIGAILAQSVAWQNVELALKKMAEAGVRTLQDIEVCPEEALAPLIRSTLYFNQKAKKLKTFAAFFSSVYGGDFNLMQAQDLPMLRTELLGLKGLGPETVDSILLYACGLPVFVVDSYTIRLLVRMGYATSSLNYEQWQDCITARLPCKLDLYQDFHAQIVCHCKEVCMPRPLCAKCVLKKFCVYCQDPGQPGAVTRRGSARNPRHATKITGGQA